MKNIVPLSFIAPNSKIKIEYDKVLCPNSTDKAIIISGTRAGFVSLCNSIIVYLNSLEDPIPIHNMPWIQSDVSFRICILPELYGPEDGTVVQENSQSFRWDITGPMLAQVSVAIHSLGYANSELHLDHECDATDISVYCVVDE